MGKFIQHLIFCICLFSIINAKAQNQSTIRGVIKDQKTGETLIGATVVVKGTSNGTATDFDGNFAIKTTAIAPYTLVVTYVGFQTLELVIADALKPVTIKLAPNVTQLKEAEVRDSRVTEKQKQNPVTVETMDALAIKQTPAANFYEGLSHLKGVDLTSASIGFKVINTRGFNSTSPVRSLQLIDGVDNQSPGLNFSLGNFLGASELDVQKVDLIVGASGAYYGPNAFNGVINMQTKSPFQFPGLSANVKVGERALVETAVRWAQVFKNKKGEDKFAYKLNLFYMKANDWEADTYEPTDQSRDGKRNPGGFDAVNIYGDEYQDRNVQYGGFATFTGLNRFYRAGYKEIDLVDYNTKNLKTGLSLHYQPKKDYELIYAFNFGTGTTVYQGDNRFSLRDILFFQNRIEFKKQDNFFIRAYATNEDAGNSYDAYNTALKLQGYAKRDEDWSRDYKDQWNLQPSNIQGRIDALPGMPYSNFPFPKGYVQSREDFLMNNYYDSILYYHYLVTQVANSSLVRPGVISRNMMLAPAVDFFTPGTARFDSAFQAITSRTSAQGGSRFYDRSALYHIMGEKRFKLNDYLLTLGANVRMYKPNSAGTIFLDTGSARITNWELGSFAGVEKKWFSNKLKTTATIRLDKNQNFDPLLSPALSIIYLPNKQHTVRASFSSAIRNPTLTDQYFYLPVGRAILIGNLSGFDSLLTIGSLNNFRNAAIPNRDTLEYFNVDPVKPERVKTIEVGYRTELFNKLYVDANVYYSTYTDFLGYQVGADANIDTNNIIQWVNIYRVTTNSKDVVTTHGITVGANYYFKRALGFSANYSWNVLNRRNSNDPIIPAFNTPEHKYNLGINGRDIIIKLGGKTNPNWGYNINYKWIEGFMYEGSPQFTGFVPTYDMVDAQVNKKIVGRKFNTTLKLGGNNILNNKQIQVFGGPRIGRMIYFSVQIDFDEG